MRYYVLLVSLVFLVCAGGCIPLSLQPIYTPETLRWDPALLGSWGGEGEAAWTFTIADEKARTYRLEFIEDEETVAYQAHLVQLGDTFFLDLLVQEHPRLQQSDDLLALQLVPVHSFVKLCRSGDELRFFALDPDWLNERIQKKRFTVPYQQIEAFDGWPVFTGSTQRMQRFLRKWAHSDEAWTSDSTLHRVDAAAPTP